ncbi:MAG: ABC transporter substrate-binding protein, partial [bacterium]
MLIALAVLAGQAAWAGDTSARLGRVTLTLKWYHQFQFAGYYAADIKGFYREAGLDVGIIEGSPEKLPIESVLNGKTDFAVSDADVLMRYLEGAPLVALAAVFQHSPYILMSMKDRNIRFPSDLADKTLMMANDQGGFQFKVMLLYEGIPNDKIHLVPHSWNLNDLITGKVDAVSAYATSEPFIMKRMGYEISAMTAAEYGIDYYGDVLFTDRQ